MVYDWGIRVCQVLHNDGLLFIRIRIEIGIRKVPRRCTSPDLGPSTLYFAGRVPLISLGLW